MKKLFVYIMLAAVSFTANAGNNEIGVLGGIKTDGGYTASIAYYRKVGMLQIGPVLEMSSVVKTYKFLTFNTNTYTAISPGVNVNVALPFPKGHIYPGVTARYRIGSGSLYEYKGLEYGLQAGVVYKLVKFLSINVETGFRLENIGVFDATDKELGRLKNSFIPITAGVRLHF